MMKKLFLLACAALALAACNDNDNDNNSPRFAEANTKVEEGHLTGSNLHFLGVSMATSADGAVYADDNAHVEFAGLDDFTLYMHRMRFAAAMPALEMRLYAQPYTPGTGASLSFDLQSVVPEVKMPDETGGGYTWTPLPPYTLTDVEGTIDGVQCRIAFSCDVPRLGSYRVEYTGTLLE